MSPDEVRRQVLVAVERGELPRGGPSDLAARDLTTQEGYWDRWADAAAERMRAGQAKPKVCGWCGEPATRKLPDRPTHTRLAGGSMARRSKPVVADACERCAERLSRGTACDLAVDPPQAYGGFVNQVPPAPL